MGYNQMMDMLFRSNPELLCKKLYILVFILVIAGGSE